MAMVGLTAILGTGNAQVSEDVLLTAQVGNINPGPTVSSPGDPGGIQEPEQPKPALPPEITVDPIPQSEIITRSLDGQLTVFYKIKNQFPFFYGSSNIAKGLVTLDVQGPTKIFATTHVDGNGKWSWQAPIPFALGEYAVTIRATSQSDPLLTASKTIHLIIEAESQSDQKPPANPPKAQPGKQPSNNIPTLPEEFNEDTIEISLSIPRESKTITPGGTVIAKITIHSSAVNKKVQLPLLFTIQDGGEKIIYQGTESFEISQEFTTITKSFYASSSLANGEYTINALAKLKEKVLIASDTFSIIPDTTGAGLVNKPPGQTATTLAVLFGGVASLFVAIAFFEYRRVLGLTRMIQKLSTPKT
jgi:hypothetical protein